MPQPSPPATPTARQVNDVEYVEREAALEVLGVRKETLYTYVSRGLIRTMAQPGLKTKLYRKSDVEKLRTRSAVKAPVPRISETLRYGAPIAPTWITEITPQGPSYRGHLATDLVRQERPFEVVAELLWTGVLHRQSSPWPVESGPADATDWLDKAEPAGLHESALRPLAYMASSMSGLEVGSGDGATLHLASGRRLIQAFASTAGRRGRTRRITPLRKGESIAQCMARGLGVAGRPEAVSLIDAALTLSADHELSAPTFAARICASTGADLPACLAAALMAQSGPMQVGGTADVEALLDSLPAQPDVASLPCFDHPLYDRDPRARLLLERVARLEEARSTALESLALVKRAHTAGRYPNLFAALVICAKALGLPRGSAGLMHTVGRSAGWIAHAIEQRVAGAMLRPRAKYMGSPGKPTTTIHELDR